MLTLYATCGLSFAGKTTLAKRLADTLGLPRVSLDEINSERGLDGGIGMTDVQWEETSAIAVARLQRILDTGQSVVLDDTLSHRFLRDRYRALAIKARARFMLLFVDTNLEEIESRMRKNHAQRMRNQIQRDVFESHRDRFERPTSDENPICLRDAREVEAFLASLS